MEHSFAIASLWLALAVLAAIISYHLRVSIALVEICVGVAVAAIAAFSGKADALGSNLEMKGSQLLPWTLEDFRTDPSNVIQGPLFLLHHLTALNRPVLVICSTIWGMNSSSPISTTSFSVFINSNIVVLVLTLLRNLGLKHGI
jgi:hypothetical protein